MNFPMGRVPFDRVRHLAQRVSVPTRDRTTAWALPTGPDHTTDDHDLAGGTRPGGSRRTTSSATPSARHCATVPGARAELTQHAGPRLGGPDKRCGRLAGSPLTGINLDSQAHRRITMWARRMATARGRYGNPCFVEGRSDRAVSRHS